MTKFGLFGSNKNADGSSNSSVSTIPEKSAHHHKRPASSRRSSYESATQGNGVVLAKNERYEVAAEQHGHHSNRPASINATFGEDIVMESGYRGYLVVFGGFLVRRNTPALSTDQLTNWP